MTFYVEGLRKSVNEVARIKETKDLFEAIAVAKRVIDDFLEAEFRQGMTVSELYAKYQSSGIVPCIFRDDGYTMNIREFNYVQYLLARCTQICEG